MKSRIEIILDNTPFPGAGQEIGGYKVKESVVDIKGKNWAIYLQGKLSPVQVKQALSSLTGKHFALPVEEEFSLIKFDSKGMTHARTNPPGDVTVVRGHMYYARPNPISSKDFQAEMDEMLIDNPDKFFTKYKVRNTDELHERLWKGVSYAGESYGWKKGDDLYHRRASFIMPKIKINKALKGATMFYHTHPAKDEPSLTSADDIQFYLDLHFAYGIKSFYTIMKHKLDHFTITGKPGGKEKYLRMEEDAFIDTVDGMIGEGEKVAKKEVGNDRPEVEFQNRITKEMVDLFNKKYKSIAKISFRAKSKNPASKLAKGSSFNPIAALSNPAPNPPIKVEDQYIAKALEELKGLDYAHEHYGADEYGHTMYVYWWLKHHLAPTPKQPKGRLYKLQEFGLDQESRRKVRDYLSQSIIGNYTYMDAVYLMALYHDIAKLREKGAKQSGWEIGAEMFRNEIGPELGLPSKLIEDIAFLFDTDLGRKGIKDEDFRTQAGDYYGAAKLVQMSDMITHHSTMYTSSARKAKEQGKIGMASGKKYKEYIMTELINDLRIFLDHHYVIQNPPPKPVFVKWVADYNIGDLVYEEVDELLGEFHQSTVPDENGKTKQDSDKSSGGHLYFMRFNSTVVPGLSRFYTANFALSSSKILINIGRPVPDDLGKKDATLIYEAVGRRLQESYPEVEIEEVEPEAIVNPRKASKVQVISLSGPSGGGKSTVMRYLNKHIPNSSTPPTYTTRQRRPTDGRDRVFVSKTQFKEMLAQGQFVEYTISGNGHYYGRRFKDFKGNVAIIEVSLDGKKHYEKRFANLFTIYLDPDPSITEEERAKAIYRRGGLTKEEAKRRAKKATETVAKSKKMQFDLRVTMMKGKYDEGAKKVLSEIPLTNPVVAPRTLPTPLQAANIARAEQQMGPITAEEYIRNARHEAAVAAELQFWSDTREINQWNREQPRLLAGAPSLRPFEGLITELTHRAPRSYNDPRPRREKYGLARVIDPNQQTLPLINPKKELFDWFKDWVELVNMKNKELKTFLDSDWGAVAGLSPQEAKDWNNIKSGRVSGRRILKMRKKLGLTGPKDYIDPNKPRVLESYYEKALNTWTGPSDDMQKGETDWDWCKRQVRFNKRFMGDVFGERKGPLVRKQKTQNQPSRRLLSLWVWGHDPWRYARKVEKRERMPKCPSVPWIGMTEKRKWGVIEVIPGPRKNPSQTYYHGSPVKNIQLLRKGSYVSPDYQTAYDMGRYHLDTGESWTDDDLEYPMEWGTRPVFKEGREPEGIPTVYVVDIQDDELEDLGSDESGYHWEYKTKVEAEVTMKNPHYTPPPGIAMFPGELHQGPAALYQQTISISQLNPHGGAHRIPKKYEGQPASEHSDLFDDEDKENTIHGLGFKDKATAEKSVNIIKRSGKTHAHKIQAAMAMEQRARFHPNQTPGIKAAQKVYAKFIEEMKRKTKERRNPSPFRKTPEKHWKKVKPVEPSKGKQNAILFLANKHQELLEKYGADPDHGEEYPYLLLRKFAQDYSSDWDGMQGNPLSAGYGDLAESEVKKIVSAYKKLGYVQLKGEELEDFHPGGKVYLDLTDEKFTELKSHIKWMGQNLGYQTRLVDWGAIEFRLVKDNPRTKKGRKFPSKYLKGLTATERAIARYEIDKGYEYESQDPEAYKMWKSDIKAKARGLKTVPSKWRNKFARKYGPLKDGYDFLDRMSKTTGVKRKYLKKIQDKGLAAWRVGHRPGVTQMQWARGRVYAFVMAAPSSTGPGKPDHKLAVEAGVR